MIIKEHLDGRTICLRCIEETDCTDEYLRWLEDPEVNQYLETRWSEQSMDSIKSFVRQIRESEDSILFAIIEKETKKHIGNIKIGPINKNHQFAMISYFIGNREYWGKGIASEAIGLVTRFGFENLGLHKLLAGYYASNIGSGKALENNGYTCLLYTSKQRG